MWTNGASSVFAPALQLRGRAPTFARLASIPDGDAGVGATLRLMRECVHDAIVSSTQRVRECAISLVSQLPERHWIGEIRACHAFVRDGIRYTQDAEDYETVQTPEKTLEYKTGDCDDKATLLAALLKSIGHPARFVAVGINGGNFSHVLVETKVSDKWIAAETILPKPLGWYPPDATSRYVLKV